MSGGDFGEQYKVHLLTHALAMGGWLDADYIQGSPDMVTGMEYLIGEGLFILVDDPDSAPHLRFHLTELGAPVAASLAVNL